MEQDEIEEGEISDKSGEIDDYVPLERPAGYSAVQPFSRFPTVSQYSDSEEDLQSSESDSDSDTGIQRSKITKIKVKPKPIQRAPKQKKYDIWSTKVQEDVLAETLNSFDVSTKDRSRDVETYDYTLSYRYYKSESNSEEIRERKNNKRTVDDRKNVNFRQIKRSTSSDREKKSAPRVILDLCVDTSNTPEEIAKDIANKLCEEREDLVLKVVNTMGKEKTLQFFNKTRNIEKEGGLLIMNQTRRRTPGGVFFFIVRHDYHITPEQKRKIFDEDKQKAKEFQKEKKKKKAEKIKSEIAKAKSSDNLLPELLTRAEILVSRTTERKIKDDPEERLKNPPPSPETDQLSGDGMDMPPPNFDMNNVAENTRGKLQTYDDEFLDINCSNDMDLF